MNKVQGLSCSANSFRSDIEQCQSTCRHRADPSLFARKKCLFITCIMIIVTITNMFARYTGRFNAFTAARFFNPPKAREACSCISLIRSLLVCSLLRRCWRAPRLFSKVIFLRKAFHSSSLLRCVYTRAWVTQLYCSSSLKGKVISVHLLLDLGKPFESSNAREQHHFHLANELKT